MLNGNKENHHDFYKHMLQLKKSTITVKNI